MAMQADNLQQLLTEDKEKTVKIKDILTLSDSAESTEESLFKITLTDNDDGQDTAKDEQQIEFDSAKRIANNQQRLTQIKTSLATILDSMYGESLISKVAKFWYEMPYWKKVSGGILLTVPTLAAAVVTNIGILFVLGGATAVTYTAGGILLDDHNHFFNEGTLARLKAGIFDLADMLESATTALITVREKFSKQIAYFKIENDKLNQNISMLYTQVDSLSEQLKALAATEKMLREEKEELEAATKSIENSMKVQTKQYEADLAKLATVQHAYSISQIQLDEKIAELNSVRSTLGAEVDKAKSFANKMQNALLTITSSKSAERTDLQHKVESLVAKKETAAGKLEKYTTECSATQSKCQEAEQVLTANSKRMQELLDRFEKQVAKLDQPIDQKNEIGREEAKLLGAEFKLSDLLSKQGFHKSASQGQLTGHVTNPLASISTN